MKNEIADLTTVADVKQKNLQVKYANAEVIHIYLALNPQSGENNVNLFDEFIIMCI